MISQERKMRAVCIEEYTRVVYCSQYGDRPGTVCNRATVMQMCVTRTNLATPTPIVGVSRGYPSWWLQ